MLALAHFTLRLLLGTTLVLALLSKLVVFWMGAEFLPPFNEWTLTINVGDAKMSIDIISVMTFNADGKIASMKAYWTPENMTQL